MQGEKNESEKKKDCTSNELGLAKASALQVKKSFNRMIKWRTAISGCENEGDSERESKTLQHHIVLWNRENASSINLKAGDTYLTSLLANNS